jgi:cytochrome c oxidase subunit II
MSDRQHWTTRRTFITGVGFGGVALYGAWAAYGAAPLPFFHSVGNHVDKPSREIEATQGHGEHGAAKAMRPEEFLRQHEEFMARFGQPDGSVSFGPAKMPAADDVAPHGAAGAHQTQGHGNHGTMLPDPSATEATDVYLLAYRFGFTPEDIRLEAGKSYRFRMMASDIAHGASLQLGRGSRIIRLRPNVVSEQTITFNRVGVVLVYCTVFCGPAHDAMKARILVA